MGPDITFQFENFRFKPDKEGEILAAINSWELAIYGGSFGFLKQYDCPYCALRMFFDRSVIDTSNSYYQLKGKQVSARWKFEALFQRWIGMVEPESVVYLIEEHQQIEKKFVFFADYIQVLKLIRRWERYDQIVPCSVGSDETS